MEDEMKIVINKCYGGFGLSPEGIVAYLNRIGKSAYFYKQTKYTHRDGESLYIRAKPDGSSLFFSTVTEDLGDKTSELPDDVYFYYGDIPRDDENLIVIVESLGKAANGNYADLKVVEIPDGTEYSIEEYDGIEWIAEKHQTWG